MNRSKGFDTFIRFLHRFYRPFLFAVLAVLSLRGIFEPGGSHDLLRLIWFFGFIGLLLRLGRRCIERVTFDQRLWLEVVFLSLLGVNCLVQLTGDFRSPVLPVYLIIIIVSALREKPLYYRVSLGGAFLLEGSNALRLQSEYGWSLVQVLGWAGIIIVIPFLIRHGLKGNRQEKESLRKTVRRFESSTKALGPGSALGPRPKISVLTTEEETKRLVPFHDRFDGTVERLFQMVLGALRQSRHCLLFLPHGSHGAYRLHKVVGGDPRKLKMGGVFRGGIGMVGFAVREGRMFRTGRIDPGVSFPEYCDPTVPLRSLILLPLVDSAGTQAILAVDSVETDAFNDQDETLISQAGEQVMEAIHHCREQQTAESRALQMSTLLAISEALGSKLDLDHRLFTMARKVREVIPYDQCFVFLLEPGDLRAELHVVEGDADRSLTGRTFYLHDGILALVVKKRMILADQDLASRHGGNRFFPKESGVNLKPGSFVALPILARGEVIGLFTVSSREPNVYDDKQVDFLKALCSQAALSISDAKLHREVHQKAAIDGLTGVYNHRRFQERLQEETERFARQKEPFSLLMIDVDFFKKINDRFGHPVGDKVLRDVAGTLLKTVRRIDFVARYGGEEFAVLLINAGPREAFSLAERIRTAVEKLEPVLNGKKELITVSVGMAVCPKDSRDREGLVRKADEALFQAKRAGRNQTVVVSPGEDYTR